MISLMLMVQVQSMDSTAVDTDSDEDCAPIITNDMLEVTRRISDSEMLVDHRKRISAMLHLFLCS